MLGYLFIIHPGNITGLETQFSVSQRSVSELDSITGFEKYHYNVPE